MKQLSNSTIHEIFARFYRHNPQPKTELEYVNDFTLLVAVVLSAQCTDKAVNQATRDLFTQVQTPQQMWELGVEGLIPYIRSIGLYPTKAKNIIALSHILLDEYDAQIPHDRDLLETLPGVGRKTANVVANVLWNAPVIPVDTHVFRVSNRIGLCHTTNPLQTEYALETIIPKAYLNLAHHWLILHGRYLCKARKPLCHQCPIQDLCTYED